MAEIEFYEKRGCLGNAKQKALLRASGHRLAPRDLLATPWTAARLKPFFHPVPVPGWFNRSAPDVTSGRINPDTLPADEALALLIAKPILIRRPLMVVRTATETRHVVGFDQEALAAWIGLTLPEAPVTEGCPREA